MSDKLELVVDRLDRLIEEEREDAARRQREKDEYLRTGQLPPVKRFDRAKRVDRFG